MAKNTSSGKRQKSLVIVESPAKARTISKFLGNDFVVEASIGHVRDLPQGAKEVPEEFKGEDWAYLGVNVQDDFRPIYIVPPGKKQQVTKLRKALKESKDLYLATDEDREGEAISWHLCELLKPKVPVHRLVFHEITNRRSMRRWRIRVKLTRAWCGPRRHGGSWIDSTATTYPNCCGRRSGPACRQVVCRASRCG